MWQEVAQTKKSREMVAISSKDVKDCERIVVEVERWLLSAGSDPCCSNSSALSGQSHSVMVQVGGWTPPFYRDLPAYGAGGGLDPSIL